MHACGKNDQNTLILHEQKFHVLTHFAGIALVAQFERCITLQ